jgi:hypothetical protein
VAVDLSFSLSFEKVAVDLWAHARAAGMFGAVFTVYELHSGDVAIGTPFERMDPCVLHHNNPPF